MGDVGMDIEAFLRVLPETTEHITWHVNGFGAIRGTYGIRCFCPVNAVYWHKTRLFLDMKHVKAAGDALGMESELVDQVAAVSDCSGNADFSSVDWQRLRRDVLTALGLKENQWKEHQHQTLVTM